jgi:phosphoglucosamine mutase
MALFGTDGIRGLANRELTAEIALDVAVAAAHILVESKPGRAKAIVGQDSRASGEFLEAAVVAGLTSAGVDVYRVGVLPTPAISYLIQESGADLGVMISASHNPMPDNGIKLFASSGGKLDDALEAAIEQRMEEPWERPIGRNVGRAINDDSALDRYVAFLLKSVSTKLTGIKVVVDCANGAASKAAPIALAAAGAEVIAIANQPDGWNINDGVGSTHLDLLRKHVIENKADIGIAHDGDADRCLAIAADGSEIDGDQILAILTMGLKERNELKSNTVVATVMIATPVGDRYVLEKMLAENLTLGGEQSGHIINRQFANTGDGILTALQILQEMARSKKSISELASVMKRFPQVLINVKDVAKENLANSTVIADGVKKAESELGTSGRVLLRASGTEKLVRVMVEASSDNLALKIAEELATLVKAELG